MVRYLLGDLTEEERLRVEERFFTDDEVSEQLLALENELLYDYAQGALTPRQRELYERRFLATQRERQRAEFAAAILDAVAEAKAATLPRPGAATQERTPWRRSWLAVFSLRRPTLRFSLAAMAALFALGSFWLITETIKLRAQLEQLRAQHTVQEQKFQAQS